MIKVSGLVKRYGNVLALDGLDLAVPKGTIFGLLGPNGAGKTTAIRILTTLLEPDGGSVQVAGVDVIAEPNKVRERIGLSGQAAAIDEHLTGFENLDMVGRLYHLGRKRSRERARELLREFDLTEAGDRPAKTYSGGMRRRLDLAAALVARPEVLFLDEPTTGLDPRSRVQMWDTIQDLVREGATVLLTTQYMEEADRLADHIVVIDRGKVIAQGTCMGLKAETGGERIELVLARRRDIPVAKTVLAGLSIGEVAIDEQAHRLTAAVEGGVDVLRRALHELSDLNVLLLDVGLRRPTLDDVFLTLTGHLAEESPQSIDGEAELTDDKRRHKADKETVR